MSFACAACPSTINELQEQHPTELEEGSQLLFEEDGFSLACSPFGYDKLYYEKKKNAPDGYLIQRYKTAALLVPTRCSTSGHLLH